MFVDLINKFVEKKLVFAGKATIRYPLGSTAHAKARSFVFGGDGSDLLEKLSVTEFVKEFVIVKLVSILFGSLVLAVLLVRISLFV